MPIFQIHHITKYEYDRPVIESNNEIKIFPFLSSDQEVLHQDLNITNHPDVHVFTDYWGNKTGTFNLAAPHKELVIESRLTVRTTPGSQLRMNFHEGWDQLKADLNDNVRLMELSLPDEIKEQQSIDEIIASLQIEHKSVALVVEQCSEFIYKYFKYIKGITNIETTVDEILNLRSGVCQDFAHVLLQLLRTIGIPCRYVSGYICPNKNGMRGEGATHAWVEAHIPGHGWAGIDPTNNVWVTNNHVKLAVGNHFSDCTPVKGTFKGLARQKLSVFVSIGYEDGHIFEEQTHVKMEAMEAEDKLLPPIDELAEQQAQQQQQQ